MSDNPSKAKRYDTYEPVFRIPIHIVRQLCQDKDFVDCGANVGQHVSYFLPHCKRYIAIDCDTRCILSLTSTYKNTSKLITVQACLSYRPEIMSIYLHNKPSINFVQHRKCSNEVAHYHRAMIYTTTLDAVLQNLDANPGIIKLDIEGAEYIALLGAVTYISSYRPLLMIEIHPQTQFSDLIELLKNMGYEIVRKGRCKLSNNLLIVFAHTTIISLFQGQ
jgi:FkbM family methyltransferase